MSLSPAQDPSSVELAFVSADTSIRKRCIEGWTHREQEEQLLELALLEVIGEELLGIRPKDADVLEAVSLAEVVWDWGEGINQGT